MKDSEDSTKGDALTRLQVDTLTTQEFRPEVEAAGWSYQKHRF